MLDTNLINKIEDFVQEKPRSINEIASFIKKNWRTADRYIDYIKENFGTIESRTFREGTRGALKIVYWSSIEKRKHNTFQNKLAEEIELFKNKEDFSAFDIYQYVPNNEKEMIIEKAISETKLDMLELSKLLSKTNKQLLSFSGNLSWINLKNKEISLYECIENLVRKNVSIKIICRVEFASIKNINKLLDLNSKYGKELIEIRHREQPLRAFVFDNKIASIKEVNEPTGKINELDRRIFIFYRINNKEWVEWISKIFWNLFSKSIDANKRLEQMKDLR